MKHGGLFLSSVLLSATMAQCEHWSPRAPRTAAAPAHQSLGRGERASVGRQHCLSGCTRRGASTRAGAGKMSPSARVQAPPRVTGFCGGSRKSGLDPKRNPVTLQHLKTGNEGWVRGKAVPKFPSKPVGKTPATGKP